jgi:hypothetical protein
MFFRFLESFLTLQDHLNQPECLPSCVRTPVCSPQSAFPCVPFPAYACRGTCNDVGDLCSHEG